MTACAMCPGDAVGVFNYTVLNGRKDAVEPLCESCATVLNNTLSVSKFEVKERFE